MTIAQPRTRPNSSTREHRARALAEERFEEIAAAHRGGLYTVPASGGGSYDGTYTRDSESCSCKDWQFGHTCYHVMACAVVRAKTSICSGCGRRFRHHDHESAKAVHKKLDARRRPRPSPASPGPPGPARSGLSRRRELRLIIILRTSPPRSSKKFAITFASRNVCRNVWETVLL
jgi:hypothetical protein